MKELAGRSGPIRPSATGRLLTSFLLPAMVCSVMAAGIAAAGASTLEPRGPTDECRTGAGDVRVPKCETVVV